MNLEGRRIFITGAATGIGRATVECVIDRGARVFGAGLDEDEGHELQVSLETVGDFCFRRTDVTQSVEVNEAVSDAVSRLGGLDGVVNCAGIYPTGKRLEELTDAEWELCVSVNLSSVFRVCRATLPHLRAAGGGSVVNIASVHSDATTTGVPAYAATKAGIVGLSRQIALDYAIDLIRVNSLMVGAVATRMGLGGLPNGDPEAIGLSFARNKIARFAEPAEIATVIAFLLTDDASFVTGSAFQVDAGLLSRLF